MESLPISYFDTHSHGDIMSVYTNDIDTLRQFIGQSLPQLFSSIISIVSVFVSMIVLNVPLTLLTLVMVALMLFATKKIAGKSGKFFVRQQQDLGKVNGYIEEMMQGQKVVKVFNHEQATIERFRRAQRAAARQLLPAPTATPTSSCRSTRSSATSAMYCASWRARRWRCTAMSA